MAITNHSQLNMKSYFAIVLGIFVLTACSGVDENSAIENQKTIQDVTSDVTVFELNELQENHAVMLARNEFNLTNVDFDMIKEGRKNVKSNKELILLYEKAGMTNAAKYVQNNQKRIDIISSLVSKNPNIKNLSQVELMRMSSRMTNLDSNFVRKLIKVRSVF